MTVQTHHAAVRGNNLAKAIAAPPGLHRNGPAQHKQRKNTYEPRMLLIPFDLPEKSAPFTPLLARFAATSHPVTPFCGPVSLTPVQPGNFYPPAGQAIMKLTRKK